MKERKKVKQNIFCCGLRYFPGFHRYEKGGFKQIHNLSFALVDLEALLETCRMDVDFSWHLGQQRGHRENSGAPSCLFPDPALFLISQYLFVYCSHFPEALQPPWGKESMESAFPDIFFVADRLRWMGWCLSFTCWMEKMQSINSDWNLMKIGHWGWFSCGGGGSAQAPLPKLCCWQPEPSDFWDGSPHGWGSCFVLRALLSVLCSLWKAWKESMWLFGLLGISSWKFVEQFPKFRNSHPRIPSYRHVWANFGGNEPQNENPAWCLLKNIPWLPPFNPAEVNTSNAFLSVKIGKKYYQQLYQGKPKY